MSPPTNSGRKPTPIQSYYAREWALRAIHSIARLTGCWQARVMEDDILFDLIDSNIADIEPKDLRYLETADIIIVAKHRETGETHYIAVESCFTAQEPYTRRAAIIAGYLARFTGQTTHAVVASWYVAPDVEATFASGQVKWYGIDLRHLAD